MELILTLNYQLKKNARNFKKNSFPLEMPRPIAGDWNFITSINL